MSESSLKQKTIGALLWNLLDRMGQQVLLFIVGILVANILSVEDYALVGMLAIFSAIANIIQDSGFSAALIQKKETTAEEFSSVFWFNLGMSILLYGVLMGCSPLIARFFNQPRLVELSAVIFLALPINALTIIQSTILNKQIRFKPLTQINLYSMTVSGIASLAMALTGCGVWTLALQPVILAAARATLLWSRENWRPQRIFRFAVIRSLFGFASSLLLASLINTCFLNIYSVIIGKLFPQKQLGYYTQGNKMCDMGVSLIYGSIQNATFPIFSTIQNERERLIRAYRKTIRFTAFITLPIMAGLFVTAGPVIRLLLKEEWWPSIPFFQLLCLGGCFTILTAINNNFIKVSGRSDGILKIEYYKIAFTVAVVLLTYREDVLTMVAGLVVTRLLVYIINMIYTAHYTGYRFSMQLMDLLPYAGLSTLMTLLLLPIGGWIENQLLLLVTQAAAGTVIYIGTAYITGLFVTAGPVIRLLLKEEWWPSIPFFQLLCLGGCFTILTAINNNFIKVSGRSDGILKIEYYKIAFTVAVVLLTYREDVLTMVAGLVVTRLLVYIINMIYTAHYTGYRFSMQLMDLLPYAGLSTLMTLLLLPIGGWIENQLLLLVTQAAAGTVIYIGTAYITGSKILKDSLELIRKKKGHEQ